MNRPEIAGRKPMPVELSAGEDFYWCACGRSKSQPGCDGSHRGTDFTPLRVTPESSGRVFLCLCKQTKNPPYCDGTHAKLDARQSLPKAEATQAAAGEATPEEPHVARIHEMARHGLERLGHHGEMVAMGVPGPTLPRWDDIQMLTAQLARKPLMEDVDVETRLVVGPNAKKPLELELPLFVSDMSFGALSEEAKVALARGAHGAGTGICSSTLR